MGSPQPTGLGIVAAPRIAAARGIAMGSPQSMKSMGSLGLTFRRYVRQFEVAWPVACSTDVELSAHRLGPGAKTLYSASPPKHIACSDSSSTFDDAQKTPTWTRVTVGRRRARTSASRDRRGSTNHPRRQCLRRLATGKVANEKTTIRVWPSWRRSSSWWMPCRRTKTQGCSHDSESRCQEAGVGAGPSQTRHSQTPGWNGMLHPSDEAEIRHSIL